MTLAGSGTRALFGRKIPGPLPGAGALASMLVILAGLAPVGASAGGFGTSDIGPRRNGMFAVMARPDDTTAIMHNPAGLANQRGNHLFLSGMAGFLNQEAELMCEEWMERYDLQDECAGREYSRPLRPKKTYSLAPFFGLSVDLDPLIQNLVVGAAIYANNIRGSVMDEFSLGRFHGIESSMVSLLATGVVSYRPSRYLSLGAGISYLHLQVESWRRIEFLGEEWDLKLQGRDAGMQLRLGVLIEPVSWASIGLSFDSQSPMTPAGEIRIAGVNHYHYDRHQTDFYLMEQETTIVLPYQIRAGVNLRPTETVELGIDYSFWRYSAYVAQVTTIRAAEGSHGMALMLDGYEIVLPQHMKDSHNVGVGARFEVHQSPLPLWLMAGVRYDWSPGDDMYFSLEMPYADSYGFALGLDTQLLPRLKLGMAWTHDRYVAIDITESLAYPTAKLRASIHNTQYQLSVQASF